MYRYYDPLNDGWAKVSAGAVEIAAMRFLCVCHIRVWRLNPIWPTLPIQPVMSYDIAAQTLRLLDLRTAPAITIRQRRWLERNFRRQAEAGS